MNLYEDSYQRKYEAGTLSYEPPFSLVNFLDNEVLGDLIVPNPKVLEVGCGAGTLFWHTGKRIDDLQLTAIDVSRYAIREAVANRRENENFVCKDFFDWISSEKFDLIVDSHFIHCLTDINEIHQYLELIREKLEVCGSFVIETMIEHRDMFVPGYDPMEKLIYRGEVATRRVFNARELEELLVEKGFKIKKMFFNKNLKMIPFDDRNYPMEGDPEVARIVCTGE